jgi:hypothetical protein
MDAPRADLRVIELGLENDGEVLLDFRLCDAKPPEMRLVARNLE